MNAERTEARKQLAASSACGSSYSSKEEKIVLPPNLHPRPEEADGIRRSTPAGIPMSGSVHPRPPCAEAEAPNPQTKPNATAHVSFFHECTPPTATAQTRRHTGRASYLPPATARAQALLRAVMEPHAPPAPLAGPLRVTLLWTWPGEGPAPKTTRPDLDNLAKLALDAMTWAGYWQDDSQVAELLTAKFTGPIPGLAVTVEPMQQEGRDR